MQTNLSPMYRCPDGNLVQFYELAVPHEALTIREGRPIIWRALVALIRSPGMKNQIHHQQIHLLDDSGKIVRRELSNTTRDKARVYWDEIFRDQLKAFKEGREGTEAMGTPLEQYPKIDVAMAATLRANGVHTLEQLKAVPDSQLGDLGPQSRILRDNVIAYLDSMTGTSALKARNDEMAKQLAAMQAQIAELTAAHADKPKRGRRPNAEKVAA